MTITSKINGLSLRMWPALGECIASSTVAGRVAAPLEIGGLRNRKKLRRLRVPADTAMAAHPMAGVRMSATPEHADARIPRQIDYIIGNDACERCSFYGMRNILTPFLITTLL
jgi:hypothetical protein